MVTQIASVLKKDFLLLVRCPVQIVGELILPILYMLPGLLLAMALVNKQGTQFFFLTSGTNDFISYIFIGTVFYYFNGIQEQTAYLLEKEMWMGTLEQIWMAPCNKIILLLGWMCFAAGKGLIYAAIGILSASLVGVNILQIFLHINVPIFLVGILGLIVSTICSGLIVSSITLVIKKTDAFIFIVTGLIPLLCGITYPISVLPKLFQVVAKIIPLTYCYDLVRYSLLKTKTIYSIKTEIAVLLVLLVLFIFVSLCLFRVLRRRVESWGTIGLK